MPAHARATPLPDLLLAADLIDDADLRADRMIDLTERLREAVTLIGRLARADIKVEYWAALQRLADDRRAALEDLDAACRTLRDAGLGDRADRVMARVAARTRELAGAGEVTP